MGCHGNTTEKSRGDRPKEKALDHKLMTDWVKLKDEEHSRYAMACSEEEENERTQPL
jgi:hypothetical protein